MSTSTNPIGLSNTNLFSIRALSLKQEGIRHKIGELQKVTDILAMKPWTQDDVTQRTRLKIVREAVNFDLVGTDGFSRHDFHVGRREKEESPFWACVNAVKNDVFCCLSVHLGFFNLVPTAVMLVNDDNSRSFNFTNVLGVSAEGQVAIVFPLVALLYATFDIPVPQREAPLWSMMTYPTDDWDHVFPGAKPRVEVPVFECLDLENDAAWCPGNKDAHGVKQNLRDNVFFRQSAEMLPTMPWTTALKELVGYTKYVQSVHAKSGSFDPISAVQEHCASCIQSLVTEEAAITHKIQDVIIHGDSVNGNGLQISAHVLKMRALLEALY